MIVINTMSPMYLTNQVKALRTGEKSPGGREGMKTATRMTERNK